MSSDSPAFSRQHGKVRRGWFQRAITLGVGLGQLGTLAAVTVYASGNPEGWGVSTGAISALTGQSERTVQRHITAAKDTGALRRLGLGVDRDKRPGLDAAGRPHSQLTRYSLPRLKDLTPRTLVWRSVLEHPAYQAATPSQRGFYWVLAEFCGPSGKRASAQWLSQIAGGVTPSFVRRAVAYLRDSGLIDVEVDPEYAAVMAQRKAAADAGNPDPKGLHPTPSQQPNFIRVVPPSGLSAEGQPSATTARRAATLVDEVGLALARIVVRGGGTGEAFHRTLEDALRAAEPARRAARRAMERAIRAVYDDARAHLPPDAARPSRAKVSAVAHAMAEPLYELWPTYLQRAAELQRELDAAEERAAAAEAEAEAVRRLARGGRHHGERWDGDWQPPAQAGLPDVAAVPDPGDLQDRLSRAFDGHRWLCEYLQPAGVSEGALLFVVARAGDLDMIIDAGMLAGVQEAAGGRVAFRLRTDHERIEAAQAKERWRAGPSRAAAEAAVAVAEAVRARYTTLPSGRKFRVSGFVKRVDRAADELRSALAWTEDAVAPEPNWRGLELGALAQMEWWAKEAHEQMNEPRAPT